MQKQIQTSATDCKNCSHAPFKPNQVPTQGGQVKAASD